MSVLWGVEYRALMWNRNYLPQPENSPGQLVPSQAPEITLPVLSTPSSLTQLLVSRREVGEGDCGGESMPSYVLQMNRCFPETFSSSDGCPHSAITSETGWFCHDAITEFMAWLVQPAAMASASNIEVHLRLKRNLCINLPCGWWSVAKRRFPALLAGICQRI